ncbi:helix-turn-helix domain-containing protein [Bacillus infantis]|nr:helix-turn-helix domain-containing protein [Bacillus infantis]
MARMDNWSRKQSDQERGRREEFGASFRAKREERGLSVERAAAIIGVSADMVKLIEAGKISPEFPNLQSKIKKLDTRRKLIIA